MSARTHEPLGRGDHPAVAVMVEAEVQESSEVHCCAAVCEADPVARDSAESHFAMADDEPRNRAFNYRPVLTVGLEGTRRSARVGVRRREVRGAGGS